MSSATRVLTHEREIPRSRAAAVASHPTSGLRFGLGIFMLGLAVLMSALAVVYVTDLNRRLFIHYQDLQTQQNQLYINWGKLLLEQSTWSTQARVQSIAQQRLGMTLPSSNQIVMVKE